MSDTGIEVSGAKVTDVAGTLVKRSLPRVGRRTIGAWCFADHFGPADVTDQPMRVAQHPHMGLQTATWLIDGAVLHRDSLGSEQMIRPGELNVMTAGAGISHTEETTAGARGLLHGAQLWIAQPEHTRHGDAAFAHHGDLPQTEFERAHLTVFTGELCGLASPARQDTPIVGAEIRLAPGVTTIALRTDFEHGVLVLGGRVTIGGNVVDDSAMAYIPVGVEAVELVAADHAVLLLLGGEPFHERLYMWWNFVGRSREEAAAATHAWNDATGRFGSVASALPRIPAPALTL